ncbi:hypothetical protein ANCCAN_06096 [Ancylostoma caninum]|uniref:Uncharacterized protein n=1 Tax=Ancylostoma caninum TaxID=29170 RepID=A0A368GU54_ANCCA|nr:hypothetical protein ANCCAN_06096 [Ancylostoma caninum]
MPSLLYGLLSIIFGSILTDDEPINMCNPPSALIEKVKNPWYFVALAAGAVTVLSYVLAYLTLLYNNKRHANQPQDLARKSMRTLSIILLIFLFTRYTATIGANVLNMADVNADTVALYQNYCISNSSTSVGFSGIHGHALLQPEFLRDILEKYRIPQIFVAPAHETS